ncbi:MAG TPA: NADH-quinone oxidoreductase subunit NuoE [Candidatus Manganitrophaceae bacterium]|nr:NADH-quinone oxidoreductase subunit NuoE [Candidatus Manganitrophaceae bacterium]
MLSPEERKEIEAELSRYPTRQAVCIDAMAIVQKHRGWVPDEALQDVAALLEMAPDELDGIATFYNRIFRKPVGRHVLLLCDSVSCWVMGYERMQAHLTKRLGVALGQTTADRRFTLLPNVCLGACDRAPVMMADESLHVDLTAEKIDLLLEGYK